MLCYKETIIKKVSSLLLLSYVASQYDYGSGDEGSGSGSGSGSGEIDFIYQQYAD